MYLVEPGTRQTQKQIKISCSFSYSRNPIKKTKTNKQKKQSHVNRKYLRCFLSFSFSFSKCSLRFFYMLLQTYINKNDAKIV